MNKLIAIVGMSGSGKSVVTDYLLEKNFQRVYFGGVTMEELQKAHMEITPDNEKYMREKLRAEHGMAAYAIMSLPKIEEYYRTDDVIIDGLYSWEEYLILKDKFPNLTVVSIIVDKDIRYDRVGKREIRPFNLEQIKQRDYSEIENLAKGGPISIADYYIDNNNTFDDLYQQVDKILTKVVK